MPLAVLFFFILCLFLHISLVFWAVVVYNTIDFVWVKGASYATI